MKPFTKFILSAFLHYGRRHPLSVGITTSLIFLSAGIQISHFSLSIPPSGEWIAENINAINVTPEKGYTFAVFGDNQNSHVTFSKILEDISHDPSIGFAMGLGDLVFNGETEKYQDFLSQIRKGMKIPLLTAVGNHELYGNGRGLYYELFGPYYYSFSLGKDYFIVLDTGNKQRLDLWQRQWLEKELKNAENASHRFIFMHTPLYDPRQGHHHCLWKQEADSLLELFKKNNVSHIFAAHVHGSYSGNWDGIPFTVNGGAGGELAGKDPEHNFYSYIKVNVRGDDINIETVKIEPAAFVFFDRIGSRGWLYAYTFIRMHGIEMALLLLMAFTINVAFKFKINKQVE